jgi:hypothetical protein
MPIKELSSCDYAIARLYPVRLAKLASIVDPASQIASCQTCVARVSERFDQELNRLQKG